MMTDIHRRNSAPIFSAMAQQCVDVLLSHADHVSQDNDARQFRAALAGLNAFIEHQPEMIPASVPDKMLTLVSVYLRRQADDPVVQQICLETLDAVETLFDKRKNFGVPAPDFEKRLRIASESVDHAAAVRERAAEVLAVLRGEQPVRPRRTGPRANRVEFFCT